MGRIIILEGPDGGGKTSLARKLVAEGYTYVHSGPPEYGEDLLHQYAMTLYNANLRPGSTVIDRLSLGESIYGPLLRGRDLLGAEGQVLLRRMILGYGAFEIICLPPYEVAFQGWRKDMGVVKDARTYKLTYEAYEAHVYGRTCYDFTEDPDGVGIKHLACVKTGKLPWGVIGSKHPRFLIIGDVANHKDLDAPFISLSGSSHFLYECLHDADFLEEEMAFVNTFQLSGKKNDLGEIWITLGKPTAICLGSKAQLAFPYICSNMPHPAYWKRFHSKERQWYVDELKEIRNSCT